MSNARIEELKVIADMCRSEMLKECPEANNIKRFKCLKGILKRSPLLTEAEKQSASIKYGKLEKGGFGHRITFDTEESVED